VILADTSIWIDHFRKADPVLESLLIAPQVCAHPFIIGELALGQLRQRQLIVDSLKHLPQSPLMEEAEVLAFIDAAHLSGSGIGYIDAHLLASARLADHRLWTRDRKLSAAAKRLDLAFSPK
jgi:predicted nucleic acid-binding protein